MFNWLGNLFPYSDLHSLNLDWILSKMKETAAQAAKAVADAANALAQVAEAKAAALTAQTAAQDAQTAANKAAGNAASAAANAVQALNAAQTAQETATAANNKAQTAQETATAANNKAQTAQDTANTAQNTANTAQSAADTANSGITSLNAKFPVETKDIQTRAVTPGKMAVTRSSLVYKESGVSHLSFPKSNFNQIAAGISLDNAYFLSSLNSKFLQFQMDIIESGSDTPNTVFKCSTSPVTYINETAASGLLAVSPFIIVKNETDDVYDGFFKVSRAQVDGTVQITCKAIFKINPPFNDNTEFVIDIYPVSAVLDPNA